MEQKTTFAIKEKLLNEFNARPYEIGEKGIYTGNIVAREKHSVEIIDIDNTNNKLQLKLGYKEEWVPFSDFKRNTYHIGINPFNDNDRYNHNVNFSLHSIISELGYNKLNGQFLPVQGSLIKGINVPEVTFNPYVYTSKGKEYYQRHLCWNLEQKQSLIHSIYENISIGSIVVRKRSRKQIEEMIGKGEKEVSFKDVVDGKQRFNAILEFVQNKFPDFNGNYYGDFSEYAQGRLVSNQLLGYVEISEDADDEYVIKQFLKTNFTGVPQSKEHIEFVKGIFSHFKK